MYRVYDKHDKMWVNEVFMLPNGTLFKLEKKFLKGDKMSMLSKNRYVIHRYIGFVDSVGNKIYEGDLCVSSVDRYVYTVGWSSQIGQYCLFDEENMRYYPLYAESSLLCQVVGNVFDGRIVGDDSVVVWEEDRNGDES